MKLTAGCYRWKSPDSIGFSIFLCTLAGSRKAEDGVVWVKIAWRMNYLSGREWTMDEVACILEDDDSRALGQ
jgi:hypothetical protein